MSILNNDKITIHMSYVHLTSLIHPCYHINGGSESEISLHLLDIYCKSTCDLYYNSFFPLMLSSDKNYICPKLSFLIKYLNNQ